MTKKKIGYILKPVKYNKTKKKKTIKHNMGMLRGVCDICKHEKWECGGYAW